MPSSSKSPTDPNLLAGKVVVENIPRRPISHSDVQKWMGKYGNILEISIYKERILVQFASDLEAAGVVQCENGASFFGTHVAVKHAEMSTMNILRRSGPPVDRFRRGFSSTNDRDIERDASRERERDRNRDRDRIRDRDREHPRERVPSSMQDRRERDRDDDRRRYRDSQSPRRRSRSPNLARSDRRHVHPLNWLSEVAGSEKTGSYESSRSGQPPPPYTVAIVAVQHDLVPYAETIEKRISLSLRTPDALLGAAPPVRTHIVVLLSLDHLTPCLNDLTRDRVPFAIICTTTNWTHGSCTLRILYVPTQQEHRNMPLDDAMTLLQREYELYLPTVLAVPSHPVPFTTTTNSNNTAGGNSAGSLPVQQPPPGNVHRPDTIAGADGDDEVVDAFVPPSRHISALLRMLADARVLSIGELDEINAFVVERKRRLEGRKRLSSEADTKDLKLRILNMLYPQSSGGGPANSSEPVTVGSSNGQPLPQLHQQQHLPGPSYSGFLTAPLLSSGKSGMPPPPVLSQQPPGIVASGSTGKPVGGTDSLATANKLAENLSNPAVRHALDTLMNLPTSSLTQMSTGTTSVAMAQPGLQQQQQQLRGVAPETTTFSRGAGAYAGVKHGGVGRGTTFENGLPTDASRYPGNGRGGHFASMSQQRGAIGAPAQTHQGDGYLTSESDNGSAAGSGNNKYYGFKQPQQLSRNPGSAGGGGGVQTGGGSIVDSYRQREMSGGGSDYYYEEDLHSSLAVAEPAGRGSGWPVKRKRGKRGAILGSRPIASGYPGQRLPSYPGPPGYKGSQPRADALAAAVVASAAVGTGGGGAGLTDLMSAEVTPVGSVAEAYRADAIGGFMPSYNNPPYFHSGAPCYPVPGERFY